MKKLFSLLAVLAILALLGWLPFHAHDVAELVPAQTIIVTRSGDTYTIDIGAGVRAVGSSIKSALAALKEQVSGVLFFQTADQILLVGASPQDVAQAAAEPAFRPAAKLYLSQDPGLDPGKVTAYLAAHEEGVTLSQVRASQLCGEALTVPTLYPTDGGFVIDG